MMSAVSPPDDNIGVTKSLSCNSAVFVIKGRSRYLNVILPAEKFSNTIMNTLGVYLACLTGRILFIHEFVPYQHSYHFYSLLFSVMKVKNNFTEKSIAFPESFCYYYITQKLQKIAVMMMKKAIYEKARNVDGVTVPVECLEMKKKITEPDHFAHFHEFLEMLYLTKGNMNIRLNDKPYEFHEGELIIINSNETHRLSSVSDISEYIVIKFTPRLLCTSEQTPKETQYVLPFLSEQSDQPRVYGRDFTEKAGIPALIFDAVKEWNGMGVGYELSLKADVLKIIRYVVGFLSEQGINVKVSAGSGNIGQIMSSILEYINENFRTVSEKDVSDRFNISYSYFSRSFKQIMNMSFKEYINYLKINEAQRLLLTTGKSITDISMELGFSSSSHFINVFKKFKECSPKQYKKNISAH